MCTGPALNKDASIQHDTDYLLEARERARPPFGQGNSFYTGCFASCSLSVVLPPGKWKVRSIRDTLETAISSWVLAFKHSYLGAHYLAHQKCPNNFGLHVYQSLQYCNFLQLTTSEMLIRPGPWSLPWFKTPVPLGAHSQLTFLEANDMSSTRIESMNTWTGNFGKQRIRRFKETKQLELKTGQETLDFIYNRRGRWWVEDTTEGCRVNHKNSRRSLWNTEVS